MGLGPHFAIFEARPRPRQRVPLRRCVGEAPGPRPRRGFGADSRRGPVRPGCARARRARRARIGSSVASLRRPLMTTGSTGSVGRAIATSIRPWIQPISDAPAPKSDNRGSRSRNAPRSPMPTRRVLGASLDATDLELEKAAEGNRALALHGEVGAGMTKPAADRACAEPYGVHGAGGGRNGPPRHRYSLVRRNVSARRPGDRLPGGDGAGEEVGVHDAGSQRTTLAQPQALPCPIPWR